MSLRERTRPGLGIIEPWLPSPAKASPSGAGWIHEIKHDGFRIMARRDGVGIRLITRHGNDFTSRFPIIVAAVTALPALALATPTLMRKRDVSSPPSRGLPTIL
jgi:ATP-dependent DNA ligase